MAVSEAFRPNGYQQIPCDTAQPLVVPAGTAYIVAVAEAQAVRWRDDGVNPTTTVGMPQAVGQVFEIQAAGASQFRVIAAVAGAILNVTYYRAD